MAHRWHWFCGWLQTLFNEIIYENRFYLCLPKVSIFIPVLMKIPSSGDEGIFVWWLKVSSIADEDAFVKKRFSASSIHPAVCPVLCIRVLAKSYTARTGVLPLEDRSPTASVRQSRQCGTCLARACLPRSGLPFFSQLDFPYISSPAFFWNPPFPFPLLARDI